MHRVRSFINWLKKEKLIPILFAIFAFRILLTGLGLTANYSLGQYDLDWHLQPSSLASPSINDSVDIWLQFDSNWYRSIAENGYLSRGEPYSELTNQDIVFFPGYPYIVRFLSMGGVLPVPLIGLLISALSTITLVCVLHKYLIARGINSKLSRLAVVMLFSHPMAFIFGAFYTEAMFLALTLLALYSWHQKRWVYGWFGAYFAGLTRPIGMFSFIPGIYQLLRHKQWRSQPVSDTAKQLISLSGGPLGFLSYLVINYSFTWDWLSFTKAQAEVWGRDESMLSTFNNLFIKPFTGPNWLMFALFAWMAITIIVVARKKIKGDLVVWSLAVLALPLSSGLLGIPRYTITLFPVAVGAAYLLYRYKTLTPLIVGSFIVMQCLFFVLWSMGAQFMQ